MASYQADEPSAKRSHRPVNSVRFDLTTETTDLVTYPNEIVLSSLSSPTSSSDDSEEIIIVPSG